MSKTFFVTKTIKDTKGVIQDKRIKCLCTNDKELNKLCNKLGSLVDNNDCLVTSYGQVKDNEEYSTTLDPLGIQGTITNLIGYRSTSARALEMQAAASLKAALLAHPDIATVDGVVDHVAIHNPNIQITAVTPDLYAWGRLRNGSTYEVVDTKSKSAGKTAEQCSIVLNYTHMLRTADASVVGDFTATRKPAEVVYGVLATSVLDDEVVQRCSEAGIILLAPSGNVFGNINSVPLQHFLNNEASKRLTDLTNDDDLI